VQALAAVPAVVAAAGRPGHLEVDLLVEILSDVSDVEIAGLAVEAEAPGVAQTVGPDLVRAGAGGGRGEGIGGRDGVGSAAVDVDAQELAEQGVDVLPVLEGIAAAAAVAGADVQIAVRPELEIAAVVIGLARVRDRQQDETAGAVRDVGIGGDVVPGDLDGAVALPRVVDEEEAVGRVVRMEGQPQEPALATAAGAGRADGGGVEEGGGQDLGAVPDPDLAGLLHDEQPSRLVLGVGDVDDVGQAAGDLHGGDEGAGRRARGGPRPEAERQEEGREKADDPFLFHSLDV
jgi:hypothetical protein